MHAWVLRRRHGCGAAPRFRSSFRAIQRWAPGTGAVGPDAGEIGTGIKKSAKALDSLQLRMINVGNVSSKLRGQNGQGLIDLWQSLGGCFVAQIGRASCRESVCQSV